MSDRNESRFHITVRDVETGDFREWDVDCAIMSLHEVGQPLSDDYTATPVFAACPTSTLVNCVYHLDSVKKTILDKDPSLKLLLELRDKIPEMFSAYTASCNGDDTAKEFIEKLLDEVFNEMEEEDGENSESQDT